MARILQQKEVELLEELIGKEVIVSSAFYQQDENGVASSGSYQHEGILKEINYDEKTLELRTITIQPKSSDYTLPLIMNVEDSNWVWNQTIGIYRDRGDEVLRIQGEK